MKHSTSKLVKQLCLHGFLLFTSPSFAETTTVLKTSSGYQTDAIVYRADQKIRNIGIVVLHGKSGQPNTPFLMPLHKELTKAGFDVVAPVMPWSKLKREGTLRDAIEITNAAVKYISEGSKNVIIVGHSMGGTVALIYGAKAIQDNVIGLVPIAPGHMPQISRRLRNVTELSVEKARDMAAQGKSQDKSVFEDLSRGVESAFESTAEYYLSFYDPDHFPDVRQLLSKINVPVIWIAGTDDRLTHVYSYKTLFQALPDNANSKYVIIEGDHKSVVTYSGDIIIKWLGNF